MLDANVIKFPKIQKQKNQSRLEKPIKETNSSNLEDNPAKKHKDKNFTKLNNDVLDQFSGKYAYLIPLYVKLVRYKAWSSEFDSKNRFTQGLGKLRKNFVLECNQFATNNKELSEMTGRDKRDTKRDLAILVEMGAIKIEAPSPQYLIITITNTFTSTPAEAEEKIGQNGRSSKGGNCHFSKTVKKSPKVATASFRKEATDTFRENPSLSVLKDDLDTKDKNIYLLEEIEKTLDTEHAGWRDQSAYNKAWFLNSLGYDDSVVIKLTGLDGRGNTPLLDENAAGLYWSRYSSPNEGRCQFKLSEFVKSAIEIKDILGGVKYEEICALLNFIFEEPEVRFYSKYFLSPKCVKKKKDGVFLVLILYRIYKSHLNKRTTRGY